MRPDVAARSGEAGPKVVRCRQLSSGRWPSSSAVGRLAEEANHHPDIDIRYNRVTLALVTHDSGGITQPDSIWPGDRRGRHGLSDS